ncbi:MAG: GTP 3',8-cyclase MoaA [Desulfuromonadales bacterium]
MALIDAHGRKINYLRLSVTDRCNLRCTYCMPSQGIAKQSCGDILRYEDLLKLAAAAVRVGIEKIRVTGGEPLVRKGLPDFLRQLAVLPGLRQLVLTTNGVLLAEQAAELKEAGVQRLNISLDSLRPATFTRITRGGDLPRVLAGIAAAESLGFPIKINMVVMRGVNDDEVTDFAAMTLDKPITVRFIEYMPATDVEGFRSLLVPGDEILEVIGRRFRLEPLARDELGGPSRNYRIVGASGSLGVITPLSGHFCGECNRLRVTSTGMARSCLFDDGSVDLRPLLTGAAGAALERALRCLVAEKPVGHQLAESSLHHEPFAMAAIGG